MEPKKIALLVGALVVALVTALMARSMMMQSAAPQAMALPKIFAPAPKGPKVLVATRPLTVGTILDDSSYKYQPWPKELIQGAYYVDGKGGDKNDLAVLRGAVVRVAITAGQPITLGAVVQPGDRGFLAAALGPGMRAVTVGVTAVSGVNGFVFPGDRVDVLLTQVIDGQGGPSLKTAETIVRNARVLAADQRTNSEDKDGKKQIAPRTDFVTLEVTPRIAEKIQVSMALGSLSLSLRPIAENTSELERAIAAGDVNVPEGSDPQAERAMRVKIATRPTDTNASYVTGGDVSRFQRRSIQVQSDPDRPVSRAAQPRSGVVIVTKPRTITVANGTSVSQVSVGGN